MYCSEGCRQDAYDSYHRTECKLSSMLSYGEEVETLWLPLRIFLIGTKQGSELTNLMNDPNVYESLDGKRKCVDVPYSNDYYSILNLLWQNYLDTSSGSTNPKHSFLMARVNLQRIGIVCNMIVALRSVGFFGSRLNATEVNAYSTEVQHAVK